MEKWYIIQTRPRWERKVADELSQKGFETFYPVRKVKRKWSDRIKTVEEPLFKGCVLVKISEEQKTEVRLLDGTINFLHHNGKPVHPKEKEIRLLEKQLGTINTLSETLLQATTENQEQMSRYNSFQFPFDNLEHWIKA